MKLLKISHKRRLRDPFQNIRFFWLWRPQVWKRIYIVGFDKLKFKGDTDFSWPVPMKKHVGIGKFVEKHYWSPYLKASAEIIYFKIDNGGPPIIDQKSDFPVKTLVATYHKIQRFTGTLVSERPTGLCLLSTSECKAIMGFPKSFKIPVSRTQMHRRMGKSVAVPICLMAMSYSQSYYRLFWFSPI